MGGGCRSQAYAFVICFTALHPAFLAALHLNGRDLRTLSLTYLSLSSIAYIWFLVNITYPFFFSPLRHLPEPPGPSFLFAHGRALLERPPGRRFAAWMNQTPNNGIIHFRSFAHFGSRLVLTTPETLAEVLNTKAYDWVKPAPARRFLARVLGDGLIVVEGREHKLQRKGVAPAFSGKNIRELVPTFWSKTRHFTDAVADQMKLESTSEKGLRKGRIEINQIAQRITLDIIGKAALGKEMDTVIDANDELAQQYAVITDPERPLIALYFAVNMFFPPWLVRRLPWKANKFVADAALNLRLICRRLVAEKKAAIQEKNIEGKDILSVLIRSGQFDDDGMINQLLTFLAAGHETTSSALTWASYLLSINQRVQLKLRQEVQAVIAESGLGIDNVSADTIDAMPYLHAVCSEVLRVYPTVPVTARQAVRTTTIGEQVVPKGTHALIAQWAVNRSPELWGPDAEDFVPERWMPGTGDPNTGSADSRYSFITFLHGPRSCIGQGFAFTELKCLLAGLVLRFEMDLAEEKDRHGFIEPAGVITIKPKYGMHLRLVELPREDRRQNTL